MAKLDTLTDNFSTENGTTWFNYASPSIAATGGTLQITPTTGYPTLQTNATNWDLTASYMLFQVTMPNVGLGSTAFIAAAEASSGNSVQFLWLPNSLYMREAVSNVNSDTSITYDSVAHKWLRIREASGTVYWDTSPDGATWTNRRTKASSLTLTSVYVLLLAGCGGSETSPGVAIIDNFNIPGTPSPPAQTGGMFFAD